MLLEEIQERLRDERITPEQLQAVESIYFLLGFGKDDFCDLIKKIGIEKWAEKEKRWTWLEKASQDLKDKELYQDTKKKLSEMDYEIKRLEKLCNDYEDKQEKLLDEWK